MFFDSHAHVNDKKFDSDRKVVIERAQQEFHVSHILNVGFNRETIRQTMDLVEHYDFIYAAIGWHPHDAKDCTEEDLEWIHSLSSHPKVVALGEMGLDYYWENSPKETQKQIFRKQIRLAKECKLPIIIHDRDAHEDVVQMLAEEKADEVGGVMHCFGGDQKIMEACLSMNFYIGLGGPVTFKNAKLPKEIAKQVPEDRLLIETDCPYLAPHPYRGKRNETGYVHLVAEKIAELRGVTVEEIARITSENAKRLFDIL